MTKTKTKTKNKYEAHHLGGVLLLFEKAQGAKGGSKGREQREEAKA